MVQLVVDAADERDLYQQRLLRVWLRVRVRVRVRVGVGVIDRAGFIVRAGVRVGSLLGVGVGVGVRVRGRAPSSSASVAMRGRLTLACAPRCALVEAAKRDIAAAIATSIVT